MEHLLQTPASLRAVDMADAKSVTEQVEISEPEDLKAHQDDQLPRPESLRGLTDEEIKKLGVKTTLKLDLIIMPALTIMYILNYLGKYAEPRSQRLRTSEGYLDGPGRSGYDE